MKTQILLLFSLVFSSIVQAQQDPDRSSDSQVFTVVEEMPKYPGGEQALFKQLAATVRYPEEARDQGVSGVTYVQFIVEKNGELSSFEVIRGVHPLLDAEAVRAISMLNPFEPGKQRGRPVRVSMTIPIRFSLKGGGSKRSKKKKDRNK